VSSGLHMVMHCVSISISPNRWKHPRRRGGI